MNVVFIVLDTLRRDRLSVYNDEVDFTENLQEFSEDAVVFDQAVSQAPWTLPSHASIFTGLYPWEHGSTSRNHLLNVERDTLAEIFRKKGYKTACYTSNTWISSETGLTQGFEEVNNFQIDWSNNTLYKILDHIGQADKLQNIMNSGLDFILPDPGDELSEARNFVKSNKSEDFFLFVNLLDTHLQFSPPEEYRNKHAPDIDPDSICQSSMAHNLGEEEADFEALKSLYNGEVDSVDDKVGAFLDFLKEQDVFEDTLIVITSDHGENLGEEGLIGHMYSVSENLVHVPLMLKAPNLSKDRFRKQFELRELYNLIPGIVETIMS